MQRQSLRQGTARTYTQGNSQSNFQCRCIPSSFHSNVLAFQSRFIRLYCIVRSVTAVRGTTCWGFVLAVTSVVLGCLNGSSGGLWVYICSAWMGVCEYVRG